MSDINDLVKGPGANVNLGVVFLPAETATAAEVAAKIGMPVLLRRGCAPGLWDAVTFEASVSKDCKCSYSRDFKEQA